MLDPQGYVDLTNDLLERSEVKYWDCKIEKIQILLFPSNTRMICAACETRKHFECIDCMNNHKTRLCSCDCHDENTESHEVGSSH